MNATKRWAFHFVAGLECVNCRRKGDLTLRHFDGQRVESERLTIEQLRSMLEYIDVWCSRCPVAITKKVTSQGRYDHKREAATIADLRASAQVASRYDNYVVPDVGEFTKKALIEAVAARPCAICNKRFPTDMMGFLHVNPSPRDRRVRAMPTQACTINDVVREIERCAVVCMNCMIHMNKGVIDRVLEPIKLDGNFWSQINTL